MAGKLDAGRERAHTTLVDLIATQQTTAKGSPGLARTASPVTRAALPFPPVSGTFQWPWPCPAPRSTPKVRECTASR